jgi:hypothetical protein
MRNIVGCSEMRVGAMGKRYEGNSVVARGVKFLFSNGNGTGKIMSFIGSVLSGIGRENRNVIIKLAYRISC